MTVNSKFPTKLTYKDAFCFPYRTSKSVLNQSNPLVTCIDTLALFALSLFFSISLKVKVEEFDELSRTIGILPAPYAARYQWILVTEVSVFSKEEWAHYIGQSYQLVKLKLSKKVLNQLGA